MHAKTLICGAHTTLLQIAKKLKRKKGKKNLCSKPFLQNIISVKTSTNAVLEIEYSSYIACTLYGAVSSRYLHSGIIIITVLHCE